MRTKEKQKANWSNQDTTVENEVLPKWMKWVWTGRGIGYSLNVVLILQLTYYCTDILGMSAALVGTLLLASKVFDGVTDLIAGTIIDRTHSRWGKARPYDIFLPLMWIGTVLLFSVPNFGIIGKSIYIFIMYALVNSVCNTFLMAADPIFLGRTIRKEENRISLTSIPGCIYYDFFHFGKCAHSTADCRDRFYKGGVDNYRISICSTIGHCWFYPYVDSERNPYRCKRGE